MFRLQWDPELSTLAQVWANTCTIGRDMCRATERFPDPGQVLGLTRFDENWIPVNARTVFNYTGFSLEKVKYGIHSTLRSWYRTKQDVHPDDITDPNYIWPKHLSSNMFLEVVHGRVTHVGCGISVFIEFDYAISKEHTVNLFHHVVRVICNLSSRIDSTPREDRVYTTDPPTHPGYTVKCGCPLGYDEDEDCLCYEVAENCRFPVRVKNVSPLLWFCP
nr:venom allergen 5-like [Maniola hyperantus]